MHDVIVIGGGISGLTAASILGRKGYEVAVLEKNHTIGAHNEIQMQGFPAFEVSDLPIRIPKRFSVRKGHLWTRRRIPISFEFSRPILYLAYRGSEQSIDTYLAGLAVNEGVDIKTSSELKRIESGRLHKEITTKDDKTYRAHCILAADGENSLTRRLVGAGVLSPKGIGLGTVMDSVNVEPLEFHAVLSNRIAPLGYGYIIGHPDGKATVAVSVRTKDLSQNLAYYFNRTQQFFQPLIKQKKPRRMFSGMVTCGEGNQNIVHKNILFIGEAGGFQDPALGFGMAPAMRSAELALLLTLH